MRACYWNLLRPVLSKRDSLTDSRRQSELRQGSAYASTPALALGLDGESTAAILHRREHGLGLTSGRARRCTSGLGRDPDLLAGCRVP
jgi:hypothetical protein